MRKFNDLGHIHFVTTRTHGRQKFFTDEKCCRLFLDILNNLRDKLRYKIFAFCIMPDHAHILIQPRVGSNSFESGQAANEFAATRAGEISYILKMIKGVSARQLNKYLNREGSFWQKDFYDFNIYSDKKFNEKFNYIHNNPIKTKLVDDISKYKYSSWRNYEMGDNSIFKIDYIEY